MSSNVQLRLLGTATSQGIPVIGCDCKVCSSEDVRDKRLRTSALFSVGDKNIVIDSGPDFRQQMLANQIERIEAILYTHEHNDHVAGLDDIRPFNFRHEMDMPLYGLSRVLEELKKRFKYVFTDYPGVPRIVTHKLTPGEIFKVSGIEILPIQVMHGALPILGYRVSDITYLTDVKTINSDSISLIKDTRILVVNALRNEEHHSHFNLKEALDLINEVNPEKAFLIHMSHLFDTHENIQKLLPDNVFVGYDGMVIE